MCSLPLCRLDNLLDFLVGRGLSLPHSGQVSIDQADPEKPLPSLYRLDCWYLVLRHNLEITILPMCWACGTHCLLSVVQHNGYINSLIERLRWLDERRLGVRDTLSQPSTRCRGLAATKN